MTARGLAVAILALAAVTLPACGGGAKSGSKVDVTATTTQVADLVRAVGGARVDVTQILRPNSDPHGYEPRPSDAVALSGARVVFRSGGDVDSWLQDLVHSAGGDAPVIDLSKSVRTARAGGELDPHWWQDPRNARRAVQAIRRALVRADPAGRRRYDRNAAAYEGRLDRLDRAVARCVARIPPAQRKLVTTHDALGYYARRYGIEVVGALIPSLSTQAQPSAKDIEALVGQIRKLGVKAIFAEAAVNPKLERAVSRETGARVGGALWADSLGPKGSDGATYLSSIAANTAEIVRGLTGGAVSCQPRW